MREGQPQPPLLCQYFGLRQFWKDRQRNWKINCIQINSMSGQPKFHEHSILFKSVCTNSRPHDHIPFKTCEENQKKEYCQERDQLFGQWRSGNLMRCCPRVIGPQIWQSADIAKVATQRHAQYVVMCADMIVEPTWRKYFHSPIKGERYHKLKGTNWYVLNPVWVCCFLSRWYFKENYNFLSFRKERPHPVLQKCQRGIIPISCSCPKTWKNSNRQIPLILLLTNIHGFLTCEYRQHEVFKFG